MVKGKAVDILRALSPQEFKEFGKFVRSPFFNENTKLIQLYELMKKHYPHFSKRTFTKQNLYQRLFPGREYSDGTIRKLLSELHRLGEEYLINLSFAGKRHFQKDLALLDQLDEKKLDHLFHLTLKKLDVVYKRLENLEDDYFISNFALEVARNNFNMRRAAPKFPEHKDNLVRSATYLILHCLIMILKLNHNIMDSARQANFNYQDTIIYEFLETLGPEKFLTILRKYAPDFSPILEIYFYRFMVAANLDEDDKYYFRLKELVFNNLSKFSRFEKHTLLLFVEASCIEKCQTGKDFNSELNHVHRLMLSTGIYSSDAKNYLNPVRFRNFIFNALQVGEIEWAENVIKNHVKDLPPKFQNDMLLYARACVDFKCGNYDKALQGISKVKYSDYAVKFDVWTLKLKALYELGYFEEALYSLDSYAHSLKQDTTSPQWIKTRFSNFIRAYRKLLKLKYQQMPKTEARLLRDEITKTRELLDQRWLLEKI